MIRIKGRQLADFTTLRSHIQPEVYAFLEEWFNDRDHVLGHTSGSTGIPKEIRLFKEDMRASARINQFLFQYNGKFLPATFSFGFLYCRKNDDSPGFGSRC